MSFPAAPDAHTSASGANGGTSAGINTTGTNLLVAVATWYNGGGVTPTISDSNSNSWVQIGSTQFISSNTSVAMFYVSAPTVGTGQTFTINGTSSFATLEIQAWSGAASSLPLDQFSGAGSSLQPGSVTPTQDNELLVTGIAPQDGQSATAINQAFIISDNVPFVGGSQHEAGAMAYLVETTAAAQNPTWTVTSLSGSCIIATFKAATATTWQGAVTFSGSGSLVANIGIAPIPSAAPLGWFDPELVSSSWFDPELQSLSWFDRENIVKTGAVIWQGLANFIGVGTLTAPLLSERIAASTVFSGTGLLSESLIELAQITTNLNGAGVLTGAGIPEQFGLSTFNGTGNLAISLTEIEQIIANLSGNGILSGIGIPEQFGSTNLNGAGFLGVSLTELEQIVANFNGSGGLSAALLESMLIATNFSGAGLIASDVSGPFSFAATSLAGSGNLFAAITEIEQIITSFFGAGSFITDLSGPQQFGTANFSGSGAINASLLEIEQIVASLVGSGALTAALTEIEQILVGLSGAGSLAANTATPGPSANFNGTGSLVAVATLKELVVATFAAVGALQAATAQREVITAILNGLGLLNVDLSIPGRLPILATLSGSGSFIASTQILEKAIVSLVGNGVLQGAVSLITPATAILSAAGSLLIDIKRLTPALALFQGAGSFASSGVLLLPIGTSFSGEGVLVSPQLQEIFAVVFSLSGLGNLQVDSVQILSVSSNFIGQGLLITDIEQASANSLVFLGEGDLYAKLGHKVQFINDTNRTIYDKVSRSVSESGFRIIYSSGGRRIG